MNGMSHPAFTPSRSASSHFSRYSFPVPQRVGGWVGLGGWLHNEVVFPPEDGHPSQYQPTASAAAGDRTYDHWAASLTTGQLLQRQWHTSVRRLEHYTPPFVSTCNKVLTFPNQSHTTIYIIFHWRHAYNFKELLLMSFSSRTCVHCW